MISMARGTRVLVLTSTFPRWQGDVEPSFVLQLCRGLQRHCEVRVVAPHFHGAADHEILQGVTVDRFHYWISRWQTLAFEGGIANRLRRAPWKMVMLPFFMASQLLLARKLLRRESFDAIHAHWIIPQGLVALLAVWGMPAPRPRLLCTSHGGDWYVGRGALLTRLKRRILRHMAAVAVVGERMRESMVDAGVEAAKISVLPMGADLKNLFVPRPDMGRDPNIVLFAGRLVEKKGLPYLIHAMAVLRSRRPAVRLLIAGWGPEEPALRQQVAELGLDEGVEFLGAVPHPDLADWYRRAALAVFPFVTAQGGDEDGLGLVIVEALGCECPVVASALPAVKDTVIHEHTGLLVPPRNSGELASAIERLLEDPGFAGRLGQAGRGHVIRRFDWDTVSLKYARWLEDA